MSVERKASLTIEIETWLCDLLTTAQLKGLWLRFPDRFSRKPDIGGRVGFACQQLDRLGVSWSVQNQLLEYINGADRQVTWESLYKTTFLSIARSAIESSTPRLPTI